MNSRIFLFFLLLSFNLKSQDNSEIYNKLIKKNLSIYNIKDSTIFIKLKYKNRFNEDTLFYKKVFYLRNLTKNKEEIFNAESYFIYHYKNNMLTYESLKVNNFDTPIIVNNFDLNGKFPHSSIFLLFMIPTEEKGDFNKKIYSNKIDYIKNNNYSIIKQSYKNKNRYRKIYFDNNFKIFKLEEFNNNKDEADEYLCYTYNYLKNNCFDSLCKTLNLGFYTPSKINENIVKQLDTINKATKKIQLLNNKILDIKKEQYYLLDYWYFGCGPCMKMMPYIHSIQDKSDTTKLKIIGVNTFDKQSDILRYFEQKKYYTIQLDSKKNKPLHDIYNHPTLILVDGNLKEVKRWVGFGNPNIKDIEKTLKELKLMLE